MNLNFDCTNQRRLSRRVLIVLLAAVPRALHAEEPLSIVFTFQGQIKEGGMPFDGTADFEFTLWDDPGTGDPPTGGSQIGYTQAFDELQVTAGLFTVELNGADEFGPKAFNGDARWIQVSVRDAEVGGEFTTLAPRQEITAAPIALYALKAETAESAESATSASLFEGQPPAFYQDAANINKGTLADARLSANVALLGGEQTFTDEKHFLARPTFDAPGYPFTVEGSELVGNLNSDLLDGLDSTAFLQSVPLPLKLNGTTNGHIIMGENASTGFLPIGVYGLCTGATGIATGVRGESSSTSGQGVYGQATAASGATYGGRFVSYSSAGFGVYGRASADVGYTYGGYFESDSENGRGVHGVGHYGVEGVASDPDGYGGYFLGSGTLGSGKALFVAGESDMLGSLKVGAGGTVDDNARINVLGGTDAAPGGGGFLVTGPTSSTNIAIDNNEIMARNNGAVANLALNGSGGNVTLIQGGTGFVGVGTSSPVAKLHVEGGTDSSRDGGGYLVTGNIASTNITMDNNEIMARNDGAVSTLYINNDGGDVVFGGPIDFGYERIRQGASTPGTTAYCPVGKRVLGGGCSCGTASILESYPNQTSNGWTCVCSFLGVEAFAICAHVK